METNILELIHTYNVKRHYIINDIDNINYINTYVNHIYVINLEEDIIRRRYITILMQKYNINFEFIIVPRLKLSEHEQIGNPHIKVGEAGCYLSHMYCLNDAITNKYEKIIIFEDDIILHKNFCQLFERATTDRVNDILFLGASDFNFKRLNYSLINNDTVMYRPNINSHLLRGTFAIFYSAKGYLEVFKHRLSKPTFMDDSLILFSNIFTNTFFVCYPNIVLADLSTTNIDHNFWLTNKGTDHIYYKKCFNDIISFKDYNYICIGLFKNCIIHTNLSYKDNMINIFSNFFKTDKDCIQILKDRFTYNFFSVDDLIKICN